MAAAVKYYCYAEDLHTGVHTFGTDVLKLVLTNTAPTLTHTQFADLTEIADGNGYTTGGLVLSLTSAASVLGVFRLIYADYSMTASGGSIGPYRYAHLINTTADRLIQSWDRGSSVTKTIGQSELFDFDQTEGILKGS